MSSDDAGARTLQLKIYSGLLPIARRAGHARALGLWYLLRAIDAAGSGRVGLVDLRAAAAEHFTRSTFYRAFEAGTALGFWRVLERDSGPALLLTGLLELARRHGLSTVGTVPALVGPECLASVSTLRAAHHAALVAEHATHTPTVDMLNKCIGAVRRDLAALTDDDREQRVKLLKQERGLKAHRHYGSPISRRTLNTLGSGTRRTQLRYEDRAGDALGVTIKSTRNLRRVGLPASMLRYARDTIHGGCFVYRDAIVQRLPDSRSTNLHRANRGRTRKINRTLRHSQTLVICGAGERQERRIFFPSAKQAELCEGDGLKLVRAGKTNRGRGVQLWDSPTAPTVDSGPLPVPATAVKAVVSTVADVLAANWKRVGG